MFATLKELRDRYGAQIHAGQDFDKAVQDLVEQVYASGKFPGTDFEIELSLEDHDDYRKKVVLDTDLYQCLISARTTNGGFTVVDQTALQKQPAAGSQSFVDMGVKIVEVSGVEVAQRTYLAPIGLLGSTVPVYGMVRAAPPAITENEDLVPITPPGAVLGGILAIGYEAASDPDRAKKEWASFWEKVLKGAASVEGPKKRSVGFASPYQRKRTNFR